MADGATRKPLNLPADILAGVTAEATLVPAGEEGAPIKCPGCGSMVDPNNLADALRHLGPGNNCLLMPGK